MEHSHGEAACSCTFGILVEFVGRRFGRGPCCGGSSRTGTRLETCHKHSQQCVQDVLPSGVGFDGGAFKRQGIKIRAIYGKHTY